MRQETIMPKETIMPNDSESLLEKAIDRWENEGGALRPADELTLVRRLVASERVFRRKVTSPGTRAKVTGLRRAKTSSTLETG
jgi:hypothetical protein